MTAAAPTAGPPAVARPAGHDPRRAAIAVAVAGVVLVALVAVFMTYDLKGSLSFALELRARKVATMLLVGAGLGAAAVLFQTITANRILTPSLIGLDSVYVLIQTVAAYLLGAAAYLAIDERYRFVVAVVLMVAFALGLNALFLRRAANDLPLLVLGGVVLGGILTAASTLALRLVDPAEFLTVVDQLFADFSTVNEQLLGFSAVAVVVCLVLLYRKRRVLDVVALGRPTAIALGVDYDRVNRWAMVVIAVLVSVPTALVGPVTFLGLLGANLAYEMSQTFRHHITVPLAVLASAAMLVAAQLVVEEVFSFETRSSIVIGFIGGLTFIVLVLRDAR